MDRALERGLGLLVATAAVWAISLVPAGASAFCGTYVSGGDSELFNNATQVVMMRDGKQTVLSMQNDYQGPPKDFAMIVPTPQVLEKKNVKTIEDEVFERIDRLTAPRLVEYWEKDPCYEPRYYGGGGGVADASAAAPRDGGTATDDKVDVEAQFDVGEYEVVVLSSSESSALETWLQNNGYNIPSGANTYLRPYVMQDSYFFVAKVDSSKVEFNNGRAVLSPLRFHYESDQFKLPVRLGLINSSGKQDLIVNILARDQRYRVANYPNTTIPTNLRVDESVKQAFPSFYRALFKRTLRQNQKNGQNPVVTEYSWNASTCDPCPGPALRRSHFLTLGADVLFDIPTGGGADAGRVGPRRIPRDWTITRLHARYDENTLGEDLVFEQAPPIRGGRGEPGDLKRGAQTGARANRFQGRYIITHPWEGDVDCQDPEWGRWGGKNGASAPSTSSVPSQTNRSSNSGSQEIDLDEALGEENDDDDGASNGGSTGGSNSEPQSDVAFWSDAGSSNGAGASDGGGGGACSTRGDDLPVPLELGLAVVALAAVRLRRR